METERTPDRPLHEYLRQHARSENMSTYKAPREVRFIDALPATGAGKVLRRLLKDAA